MRNTGSVEPQPPRQGLGQAEIRPRLALRRHRGRRVLQVVGAVGAIEILGFEIGGGRQYDVGIARGQGQKRVVDHGEQILAREPAAHLAGIGAGHRRIVGGDEEPADRRVGELEQCLAEAQMVDRAGLGRARRLAHEIVIELARGGGQQQGAAARSAVGAGQPRQQRHRAQRLAALGEPGHAFAEPDERRLRPAVECCETLDVGDRETGDRGGALGREMRQDLALEPIEAGGVPGEVGAVAQPVARQDMHDPQSQGRVGADADGEVPVGPARGAAAARVDDHQLDAAFSRRFDLGPEMHVGGDEIGAPGDDQIGVDDRFRGRRRRPARRSCPRRSRSRCRTPCRRAGGSRPAHETGR